MAYDERLPRMGAVVWMLEHPGWVIGVPLGVLGVAMLVLGLAEEDE